MPTNLTNNTITSTYNQLLHVSDGPTSSLKTVYSGTGTATALQVSTLAVAVDNLQFDANTISSTNTNGDIYLTPNGTGQVTITNANFTGATTFTGTTINGGNLRMTSNTLSSTNTNGNVVVAPNGTGDVQLDADTVRMGDANVDATLTTNGTGDMIISTNSGTNSGIIRIFDGVNGNITLTPNGTGDVVLSADTVQIGDSNVDATITTTGTGDLILNTNSGTNSGVVRIYDGVNGNIELTPNGTGQVILTNPTFTGATTFTGTTINGGNLRMTGNTLSSTNTNGDIVVAPNGTGDVQLDTDTVRIGDLNTDAVLTTNGTGDITISTNSGTNSGIIRINQGIDANIDIIPNGLGNVHLYGDTITVGDLNTTCYLTTNGTGDLGIFTNGGTNTASIAVQHDTVAANVVLTPFGFGFVSVGSGSGSALISSSGAHDLVFNTNAGTSSGEIRINAGANGDIELTPNGTGSVVTTKLEATTSIGYTTGAGGSVTQLTSRTTGVTLNKATGQITLFAASISGHEADEFLLTNNTIGANDVVVVSIKSGCASGTRKYYQVSVVETTAGSCVISVGNIDNATIPSAGTDTPVLQFAVIKGAIT